MTPFPSPCPVCLGAQTTVFWQDNSDRPPRRYGRCGACQATFLDPSLRLDTAAEQAYYRLHQNQPDDPGYRRHVARLAEPLLARLPPARQGLDYGCGPGSALAALLREAGHRVALYDPLFCDDAALLSRRHDFVTCSEVAEHFHDPAAEFARLADLLHPGGVLAVMTRWLADGVDFARWHYRRDPTHVVFYRPDTLRYLAQRHGWRCELPVPDVALFSAG